ncbi:hypothetical protein L484_019639 [Morus notabilis]|uniref:Uncharacterized protein n=1 Tax=Morus notabilis TaxID=981085 RepID=W9QYH3_9ROSA|nr:hypothetical protein L484_019639 [Morus notabilis]
MDGNMKWQSADHSKQNPISVPANRISFSHSDIFLLHMICVMLHRLELCSWLPACLPPEYRLQTTDYKDIFSFVCLFVYGFA